MGLNSDFLYSRAFRSQCLPPNITLRLHTLELTKLSHLVHGLKFDVSQFEHILSLSSHLETFVLEAAGPFRDSAEMDAEGPILHILPHLRS